jgi:hypothetical protein
MFRSGYSVSLYCSLYCLYVCVCCTVCVYVCAVLFVCMCVLYCLYVCVCCTVCMYVCAVLLPPVVNPTAVNKFIISFQVHDFTQPAIILQLITLNKMST